MKNPLTALARLFRREQGGVVTSQLFANAIGQPLFVHPAMGAQIIGGYLQGAVDARPPTMVLADIAPAQVGENGAITSPAKQIAVLNISGGLVNRSESGMCDPGPVSYQDLRSHFDAALNDPNVQAIVFRIESPGGMASGMLDFSDHVFASRGVKPIYGIADDYAYSAGYGIIAACQEVWVTRSGGLGSVGVIGYHYDQSKWDANVGLKVTAIYSGSHKNDFSPHAELPEDQRAFLQERFDAMRAMFAESVAKYRGMTTEAVLATEAGVYQGQAAIDIGFADQLGTFAQLMQKLTAELSADEAEAETEGAPMPISPATPVAAPAAAIDQELQAKIDLADVTKAITAAKLQPEILSALMDSSVPITPQTVADRITHARAVADLCAACVGVSLSPQYVKANTDIEIVRAQLLELKAADGPELVTTAPAQSQPKLSTTASVYARRRNADPSGAQHHGTEKK